MFGEKDGVYIKNFNFSIPVKFKATSYPIVYANQEFLRPTLDNFLIQLLYIFRS